MSATHTNPCPKCGRTEIHTDCASLARQLTEHEKCVTEHLAAAISVRLDEIKDSDFAKALQLPDGQGDVSAAAFAAMMELRGDLWDDVRYAPNLRVAEMLEQATEPSDATKSLRQLGAEVIRSLVAQLASAK